MPWSVAISTLRAWEGRKACLSRLDSAIPLKLSRIAFSQKKVTFFPENRFSRAQIILQLPLVVLLLLEGDFVAFADQFHMIAMFDCAVQDSFGQHIHNLMLNKAFQWTRTKVGIVALRR